MKDTQKKEKSTFFKDLEDHFQKEMTRIDKIAETNPEEAKRQALKLRAMLDDVITSLKRRKS